MFQKTVRILLLTLATLLTACTGTSHQKQNLFPTKDDGRRLVLSKNDLAAGTHHTEHLKIFGKYVNGYNRYFLQGIDRVQAHAPDGGGYFIGIDSIPTESPLGYPLKLLGQPLLDPPRPTSYCSGSSYGAFIEGMNLILAGHQKKLTAARTEILRMQEANGGRREDHIKFWGKWNADGYGNYFALVNYSGIGQRVSPRQARPGDFMNISWKSGFGHSVVFLGWYKDEQDKKYVVYWASQKRTNGFGDDVVPIERIAEVMIVRVVQPQRLLSFEPKEVQDVSPPGDKIEWNE